MWLNCPHMSRDRATYLGRLAHEGLPFLTERLPKFLKGVLLGLERGKFSSADFPNFRFRRGYPVFMSGMLQELMRCLEEQQAPNDPVAERAAEILSAIQQLCGWCGKVFDLPSPTVCEESIEGFKQIEEELGEQFPTKIGAECSRVLVRYLGPDLDRVNNLIRDLDFRGRHGPGAVTEHLVGNEKFSLSTWSQRLDAVMPSNEFIAFPHHEDWCEDIEILPRESEPPVKVSLVPKTASAARVIAIEPCYRQFAQQAIASALRHVVVGKWIDTTSQDGNRALARVGSMDRTFSTIDLSNASDRLPLWLVVDALRPWPFLLEALLASRGEFALLPNGERIPLAKFASAGSATCFPVESLMFWALSAVGMLRAGQRVSPSSLRVYGDDIIVPRPAVRHVLEALVETGARPNVTKTYSRSFFRESCGGEYLLGHDVAYIKLRQLPDSRRPLTEYIESLVAFRNQLYQKGFWQTAKACDRLIHRARVPFPVGHPSSPGLVRESVFSWSPERWSRSTSAPLVRALVVKRGGHRAPLTERGALMKLLAIPSMEPRPQNHQMVEGRSSRVTAKVRWVTPY